LPLSVSFITLALSSSNLDLVFYFTAETSINDAQSATMKSLISRAGDLSKNNDRLKFALVSIRFPEAYNE